MNKLYAILYAIILFFAIISRVAECTFEALLESRGISFSFFMETFRHNWADIRYYTPVKEHWSRVKEYWNGGGG